MAAGGSQHRRRRQRDLDRRGENSSRSTRAPAMRSWTTGSGRGPAALRRGRNARRRGTGRCRRPGGAHGRSVLRPPGSEIARPRRTGPRRGRPSPLARPVARGRRGHPRRLHRRGRRRRDRLLSRGAAALAGRRRRSPQRCPSGRAAAAPRRAGGAGRSRRLGRRRARGRGLCLSRGARGARPAAQPAGHHRRAATDVRRPAVAGAGSASPWKKADAASAG